MASTPLLQKSSDATEADSCKGSIPFNKKHHTTSSLDAKIEQCIGDFNWHQFTQALLVSLAWIFDAQQSFITIFTDTQPLWHFTNCSSPTSTSVCDKSSSCSWAWNLPNNTSIISDFGLQCSNSFITSLPSSSFFIGCVIGGLTLSTLADSWLGRKNLLLFSCLSMSLSSLATAFVATDVVIYSALRFISGFGRAAIGTCALVLSTELVGKRWRGQVGVVGFFCFSLGFLSLPVMGYMNHGYSWRNLYVWTSVPCLVYCGLVYTFVQESPRWLLVRGRKEEAVRTLRNIGMCCSSNNNLTLSFFASNTSLCDDEDEEEEESSVSKSSSNIDHHDIYSSPDLFSAMKILMGRKWSCQRLSAVMVISIGIGMVYYGMPLGLGNLSFNLYLSVTLNALSELPASLITFFLIDKLSRKRSLLFLTTLSGICSILVAVFGSSNQKILHQLQVGLELISFWGGCTALNVILIYTIELFPTCVRNSALSMARQGLVLGGVFSPVLVAAGRWRNNDFFTYGVFGLVIGVCGLFVVCLPETRGEVLCDTMEEEEHKASVSLGVRLA